MKFINICIVIWFLASVSLSQDIHFANSKDSLAIPFELVNNQILLKVSFEDSPPLTFAMDTGASFNVLSLELAKKIRLPLQPFGKAGGMGEKTPEAFFTTDKYTLGLQGATLTDQMFVATSFDVLDECGKLATEPLTYVGVLGRDFFDNFVVTIDYNLKQIDLYDPQSFKYKGKGKSIPLELDNRMTIIRAKVKDEQNKTSIAKLIVDTGAGGDSFLTLNRQFAADNGQFPPKEKLTPSTECGVGGVSEGKSFEGKMKSLKIGDFELTNLRTFFRDKAISPEYDGTISGIALRDYKLTFDYPHKRMILEKIGGDN